MACKREGGGAAWLSGKGGMFGSNVKKDPPDPWTPCTDNPPPGSTIPDHLQMSFIFQVMRTTVSGRISARSVGPGR